MSCAAIEREPPAELVRRRAEAEAKLATVEFWIRKLAGRRAYRMGRPDLADDLADDLRADLFGLLMRPEGAPGRHDPARGKLTTWVVAVARTSLAEAATRHAYVVRPPKAFERRSLAAEGPKANQFAAQLAVALAPVLAIDGGGRSPQGRAGKRWLPIDPADPRPGPAEEAGGAIDADGDAARVAELLDGLPEREAEVVRLRYGIGGERLTLSQAGRRLGVTKERVRQIEARAMARLRRLAGAGGDADAKGGAA